MSSIAIQTEDYKVVFPLSFKDDLTKLGVWEDFVEETLTIEPMYEASVKGNTVDYYSMRFNGRKLESWVILTTVLTKPNTKKGYEFWLETVSKLQDLPKNK